MLTTWLNGYGPSNLEALLALIAIGALVVAGFWLLRRRGRDELRRLQSTLAEAQGQREQLQGDLSEVRNQRELDKVRHQSELDAVRARYDPAYIKALQDHLQRVIAHEFVKGLHFISTQTEEAAAGLRDDQPDVRAKLSEVRAKANEMTQHARNVVGLADLERNAPQREMVNLRGLLEGVMKELFPYAEARAVHLQVEYGSAGAGSDRQIVRATSMLQRHPQRHQVFVSRRRGEDHLTSGRREREAGSDLGTRPRPRHRGQGSGAHL